jgi:hypothetical protein
VPVAHAPSHSVLGITVLDIAVCENLPHPRWHWPTPNAMEMDMNVQETSAVLELSADELDQVSGGFARDVLWGYANALCAVKIVALAADSLLEGGYDPWG